MTEISEEVKREEHPKAAIEAILFSMGEPVELSEIAAAIGYDRQETEAFLRELILSYEDEEKGLRILQLEGAYQMCTKQTYFDCLIRIASHPRKPALTDVQMETLSIVAYKQPVTKAEIEKIRGVKSDHAVNRLIEYGLVRELGRMDAPGRPIVFGTTEEFLRSFGLRSREELPEMDLVKLEDFKAEAEAEIPD